MSRSRLTRLFTESELYCQYREAIERAEGFRGHAEAVGRFLGGLALRFFGSLLLLVLLILAILLLTGHRL